jgi:hypothetical protein
MGEKAEKTIDISKSKRLYRAYYIQSKHITSATIDYHMFLQTASIKVSQTLLIMIFCHQALRTVSIHLIYITTTMNHDYYYLDLRLLSLAPSLYYS